MPPAFFYRRIIIMMPVVAAIIFFLWVFGPTDRNFIPAFMMMLGTGQVVMNITRKMEQQQIAWLEEVLELEARQLLELEDQP